MNQKKTKANKAQNKPSFVSSQQQDIQKKESKSFVFNEKMGIAFSAMVCLLFIAFAAYILITRNSDMLFQAQNFSFFNYTEEFFQQCIALPGGLISWASCYLTQHFYEPTLGASILISMWAAIFFVAKKALKVSSVWAALLLIPVTALLISEVDTGYWLYYIKQQGYWFYATVGFLAAMLMTWLARVSSNMFYRIGIVVCASLTYCFFGIYSLLAVIYIIVIDMIDNATSKKAIAQQIIVPICGIVMIIAVPYIASNFYANIRIEDMWTIGFPQFKSDEMNSIHPQMPFYVLITSPILLAILPKEKSAKGVFAFIALTINVIVVYACAQLTMALDFQDYNYHAEMRMYRAVEDRKWDDVLSEMSNLPGDANRQMVLFKNIALLNKGEMGSKMFKYNNMGDNPKNGFDTLRVHMVQTGAPLIYMNHAKTNFAIRWCIENGVEFGTSINNMKILAQCALINNEMDAARKYLTLLQNTKYHREWAENYLPITEKPSLIAKYHEFDNIRELRDHMGSVLDGDQGLCEMYLLNYFSNTMNKESKLLQELTLNYSMVQKDIQLFWPRFFLYANMHKGEKMPIHYQEAAFLYGNLEHEVNISSMPFDKKLVVERYAGFQQLSQSLLASGMKSEEVGEAMKASYGDTFYWFYFFCRNVHSY